MLVNNYRMPKELRKRGKRAKKSAREKEEDSYIVYAKPEDSKRRNAVLAGEDYVEEPQLQAEPVAAYAAQDQAQAAPNQPSERESIWPLLDADTKAYYKQLEEKIISLEELNANGRASVLRKDGEALDDEEDDPELDGALP